MFNLHRPDVLPVDDLGVRNAVARLYGMSKPPPPKDLLAFGERWRPYRSVAAWYLWQSLRVITPGDSTDDAAAKIEAAAQVRKDTTTKIGLRKTTATAARAKSPAKSNAESRAKAGAKSGPKSGAKLDAKLPAKPETSRRPRKPAIKTS